MKINKVALNNPKELHLNPKNKMQNFSLQQKEIDLNNLPNYRPISFGAKSNADKLKYIGEENFPNPSILEEYKKVIENGENVYLCDIHKNFYSKLIDCKTLAEAKELYPEFKDVVDANEIPKENLKGTLKKFANGEFENIKLENLSLALLQKHYAQANGYAKSESYWGIDAKSIQKLFKDLNVKLLNREYFITINRETPERREKCAQNTAKSWQNPEYREKCSDAAVKRWESPEYRAQQAVAKQEQWADPKLRAQQAEKMRKMHASEGFEEKRIASIKAGWEDPERRKELTEINKVALRKRWEDPEARKKMSEVMKTKWQDPEYRAKITSSMSEVMKLRWQDPNYIAFKTQAKLEQWQDPEFREYMSGTMKAKWQNPEYREKMAIYSEALKLAWEMHPEISDQMKEIAKEFPDLGAVFEKIKEGITLSEKEEKLLMGYYKKCHTQMPRFTWIVGQTQKEILAKWKEEGIIS